MEVGSHKKESFNISADELSSQSHRRCGQASPEARSERGVLVLVKSSSTGSPVRVEDR